MTFQPNAGAVHALKAAVLQRFTLSLTHLMLEAAPPPEGQADRYRDAVARALSAGFPTPALLGHHAQMRDAAIAGDEVGYQAQRDIMARLTFENKPAAFRITALTPEAWEAPGIDVIRARFADDVGLTTQLFAPSEADTALATSRLLRAKAIIAATASDWSAELDALLSEIILAVNDGQGGFAGGSVFDLFGAILFNPGTRSDIAHHLMTLIHESSHLLLFARHLDDDVLLNDPDQLYSSPLRRQPRPMEGIFHAMWVSARMTAFGTVVLASPDLTTLMTAAEIDTLREATNDARQAYERAAEIVAEHAMFTPLGAQINADAAAALSSPAI